MIGARDRRVCETHTHEHTRAHTRTDVGFSTVDATGGGASYSLIPSSSPPDEELIDQTHLSLRLNQHMTLRGGLKLFFDSFVSTAR